MLGSIICSLAFITPLFLLGRILQVLGDSSFSIIGITLLSELLNKDKLAQYLGYSTILTAFFTICSSPLGAFMLNFFGWQANFSLLGIISSILLILCYFSFKNNYPASQEKTPELNNPFNVLLQQYAKFLKNPIFSLTILAPAMHATIASLFEFYGPTFYIDICKLTPTIFSYIRAILIFISVIACLLYLFILNRYGSQSAFKTGIICHLVFTTGTLIILFTNSYHHLYFIFILNTVHCISGDFIVPISTVKASSCFSQQKAIALSMFALSRNIISTIITLIAASIFYGNLYPIIMLIAAIALLLGYCLLSMYKYI